MFHDFKQYCSEFQKNGFEVSEYQFCQFDKYADYLVEYNKNVNLTALTSPEDILYKHFLDSVMILKYADIAENSKIIDVGTGAGFPSVPIKIMRNDVRLTLLDSLAKRVVFLDNLCSLIDIDAELIHDRAENVGKMSIYREKFDVVTARAVANLSVLAEYCLPFLKIGGVFLALKGPSEDISSSEQSVRVLGGEIEDTIDYKLNDDARKLVIIKKISQIPAKFPRNSAQIKKNPL